jgi:hypothetical protein
MGRLELRQLLAHLVRLLMASRLRRRVSQYFAAQAASTTSASTAAATGRAIKRIAGSSAGLATVQAVGSSATTRRNNVGHWVDVPTFERENFGGVPRTGVAGTQYQTKDRLNGLGVKGVMMRYTWRELEPTQNEYNFTRISTELAQCLSIGNARGQRFGLIAFVGVNTFGGTLPLPAYLAQYATEEAGTGAWNTWRWNSTIRTRFAALVNAIALQFDSHVCWEGIATSETATKAANSDPAAGYTATGFRDGLIAETNAIASACTFGRHFFYQNFFPTIATDFHLDAVVEAGIANGAMVMCAPDILPGKDALEDRVYPRYTTFRGRLPTQCSAQNDSHHWNSVAESETIQPFDTMQSIFDYARNTLKCNYVAWTWKRTLTGYRFDTDAIVINTTKTWQPSPGWVPPT